MNFYTNVTQWGNNLLVREVVDGERVNTRVKYKPTLYSAVQEPTPYKTLKGGYVTPIEHTSIKEAKEWIERYSNQPELACGNTMFSYTYIADQFPNYVKWDTDNILIVTIECRTNYH